MFHAFGNNPIKYTDPDGKSTDVEQDSDGNYVVVNGKPDDDKNIYITKNGVRTNEVLGQSLTPCSFLSNKDTPVYGAVLNILDTSGEEFLNDFKEHTPGLLYYMPNGLNGKKYDFKEIGINENCSSTEKDQYRYRGMKITDRNGVKVFASARDIGNYAAGYVAGRNGALTWNMARFGFDFLNKSTEPPVTQKAQMEGFMDGKSKNLAETQRIQERIQSHH